MFHVQAICNGSEASCEFYKKQAMRSKFLVTAKGWYWQTL